MDNLCLKVENIVVKVVLSHFFFCYYVFKNLSAAEASENAYMERVKLLQSIKDLMYSKTMAYL